MAGSDLAVVRNEIIPFLSPTIKELIYSLDDKVCNQLEEIRLRSEHPLLLRLGDGDYTVDNRGEISRNLLGGYQVSQDDVYRSIASISDNSLYAFEEEIRRGFITIPGGHRVGLAGQIVMQGREIKTIRDFSSLCFRIAREIKGCALPLLNHIAPRAEPVNSLIISPPRCGKTTILRDLTRIFSYGTGSIKPCNLVVVDERSEIAGCYRGIPQMDIGPRTDVLDACPKALGMIMAIRSLSPQVIITDEIGRREDIEAIHECLHAGVTIITSIHARSIEEVKSRPLMSELLEMKAFKTGIVLYRGKKPGQVANVVRWD